MFLVHRGATHSRVGASPCGAERHYVLEHFDFGTGSASFSGSMLRRHADCWSADQRGLRHWERWLLHDVALRDRAEEGFVTSLTELLWALATRRLLAM